MLDLIWDLFQQGQINDLNRGKQSLLEKEKFQDGKTLSTEIRLAELEKRHEQLKLVTLALWSLLRDHSGLMEADLRKYVEQIDLLDGKRDGKASDAKGKVVCSGCDRTILNTATVCSYCGTPLKKMSSFHGA